MGMLLYGRNGIPVRPLLGSFATWRSLGSCFGVTFGILAVWYPVWHALLVDGVVSQIELSAYHHGQFIDVQQLQVGQLREHCYARGRLTDEASGLRLQNRILEERLEGVQASLLVVPHCVRRCEAELVELRRRFSRGGESAPSADAVSTADPVVDGIDVMD